MFQVYFVCLLVLYISYTLAVEDYIKCELSGGGSPMLLNTLANHLQEIDNIAHEKIIAIFLKWNSYGILRSR